MEDGDIEKKIEEVTSELEGNGIPVSGVLRVAFQDLIEFGQSRMRQNVTELLQDAYGNDGQPALVLIESLEGSVEQRPALDTILKAISEL